MGKSFKDMRERNEDENNKSKSKYTRKQKIRFALDYGAKEFKLIMNGKIVDVDSLETVKPIHQ